MIKDKLRVRASTIQGWRHDIGYPKDILVANSQLMNELGSSISSETNGCEIIEPVFIGKNCELNNSIIGPYSTIADGSKIINSVVKETVVLENSKLNNCILLKSVIGSKCEITNLTNGQVNLGDYSQIHMNDNVSLE